MLIDVAHRLQLCSRLNMKGLMWRLFGHQIPLIEHLLLTCFDRLGQPTNWKPFGKWLESKETSAERENAVNNLEQSNPVEIAKHMFDSYNSIYGVRTSFMNFLHNILPDENRKLLLSCIEIRKGNHSCELNEIKILNDKKKKEYLFDLRNRYTHKLSSPLSGGGISKSDDPDIELYRESWTNHNEYITEKTFTKINVRYWPEILDYSVRIGLCEVIKSILKDSDKFKKNDIESRDYFYVDVSSLIPVLKIRWKLEFKNNYSFKELIWDISEGINFQFPIRQIRQGGYGLDWILKDSASGRYFDNILDSSDSHNNITLQEAGFLPEMEVKLIDLEPKLDNPFPDRVYKKHEMKDGSYRIAEYRSNGLYRFVAEHHQSYQNYLSSGAIPEIVPLLSDYS